MIMKVSVKGHLVWLEAGFGMHKRRERIPSSTYLLGDAIADFLVGWLTAASRQECLSAMRPRWLRYYTVIDVTRHTVGPSHSSTPEAWYGIILRRLQTRCTTLAYEENVGFRSLSLRHFGRSADSPPKSTPAFTCM